MKTGNQHTLVLGASLNPERYSHMVLLELKRKGLPVSALGATQGLVEDIIVHTDWAQLPSDAIDTITLYIGAKRQKDHYDRIIAAKPRRIIFNPGAENPELEKMAQVAGIQTIQACTLVLLRINDY